MALVAFMNFLLIPTVVVIFSFTYCPFFVGIAFWIYFKFILFPHNWLEICFRLVFT